MSAPAMSLRSTSRPRSSFRLSTTLRLFGFTQKCTDPSPPTALSQWRTMSPPGGSTLMTSAPKSARWRTPSGPLIDTPSETTRTPSSGRDMSHLPERRVPDEAHRHLVPRRGKADTAGTLTRRATWNATTAHRAPYSHCSHRVLDALCTVPLPYYCCFPCPIQAGPMLSAACARHSGGSPPRGQPTLSISETPSGGECRRMLAQSQQLRRCLPQLEFLDLPTGRHGESFHDHRVMRDLKAGQLPPAKGDQGLMGDVLPWRGENTCAGHLAETGVGHPNNLHLVDRRMPQQEPFDFDGVNVFASHLEEVFVPSQEADGPVVPHGHHVAGMQPSLGIHHRRGFLRLLIIALHQGVPPYTQLPYGAPRDSRASRLVNDLARIAGQGAARGQAAIILGRVRERAGDPTADLGHSPGCDRRAQQALRPAGGRFAACHPGGKEASAETTPIGRGTIRVQGQGMAVGIEAVDDRGPFLLDQAQDFPGVKERGQDHPGPGGNEHQQPLVQPEDVKQREVHQNHIPGGNAHTAARIDDRALNVMTVHHAFGKARGTRGIHDEHGRIWVDLPVPLLQRGGGDGRRPG